MDVRYIFAALAGMFCAFYGFRDGHVVPAHFTSAGCDDFSGALTVEM